jgi:hypothetical protein
MPYNEALAERVRHLLQHETGFEAKNMFGGICFMLNGHMCCGVERDNLMLRLGDGAGAALSEPGARPMDFTGKPMRGMIFVGLEGYSSERSLRNWVSRAAKFARSLPPKDRIKNKRSKS